MQQQKHVNYIQVPPTPHPWQQHHRGFCGKGGQGPWQRVSCWQNCPWLRTTRLGNFFFLLSVLVANLGTQGYVWGLWLFGGAPWSGKTCGAFERHLGAQHGIQES